MYRWLSNFWPCTVEYEGLKYLSSEAAYQAAKTLDLNVRKLFQVMTAAESKKVGKKGLKLREDWNDIKLIIMHKICFDKFNNNFELRDLLLKTEDKYLEETNWWGDTFWGVCNGKGDNHLGRILMDVRSELMI